MAQRALPPEGPSLVFPKKAWHTPGEITTAASADTSEVEQDTSPARQTQGLENTSVSLETQPPTSPEMSAFWM